MANQDPSFEWNYFKQKTDGQIEKPQYTPFVYTNKFQLNERCTDRGGGSERTATSPRYQ